FLIGIRERAEVVESSYENRQLSTQEALDELKKIYESDIERKKQQADKGFDDLTFFIYRTLLEKGMKNPELLTKQIKSEFVNHANWKSSERELRELRQAVYFALMQEEDDIDKVANMVDELFNQLFITYKL